MTSGGQCVMTAGTPLMLLWFVNSWDMHTLEVSFKNVASDDFNVAGKPLCYLQVAEHTPMPTLVLVLVLSSWMMSSVLQVLASYWSAPVDQSYHTTASILLMLVLDVKVCGLVFCLVLWCCFNASTLCVYYNYVE